MKNTNWLLVLLLMLGGAACDGHAPDDDDSAGDDDDDDSAGDDDDATSDDDDVVFAETTFSGSLDVTLEDGDDDDSAGDDDDSAGDDDDSAGDDDDSAGDDDDSADGGPPDATVSGSFVVRYWENLDAQLIGCEQTMAWEGTASFEFGVLSPDCNACSGIIRVDPTSVQDVSETSGSAAPCSAELIAEGADEDWGDLMTNEEGGFAWLEMPLLDVATAVGLGFVPTEGVTLQETIDGLVGNNLELTHIGFVNTGPGNMNGPDGLDLAGAGANPPEVGAAYGAFWTIFKDPATNTFPAGIELSGEYSLGSFWLLQ